MAEHTPLKPEEMPNYLRKHSFTQGGATRVHLREIARRLEGSEKKAAEMIDRLVDAADERGCPMLRDCMADERAWLAEELAKLIARS